MLMECEIFTRIKLVTDRLLTHNMGRYSREITWYIAIWGVRDRQGGFHV
jgi:hypothetical protein